MIRIEQCAFAGTLVKLHGVKGLLVLRNEQQQPDWSKLLNQFIFIEIDKGLVPFFLNSYEPLNKTEVIVGFDSVDNKEKAGKLRGLNVYFQGMVQRKKNSEKFLSDFTGYTVIDTTYGRIGVIDHTDLFSKNPMFIVDGGRVLIPAAADWVVHIDKLRKEIIFNLPDGLLDL